MPLTRVEERDASVLCCPHHFLVSEGASWLNHRNHPRIQQNLKTISKREECVRGCHAASRAISGTLNGQPG
jgi:hypothetical protein